MDQTSRTHRAERKVEKERVKPSFAFNYWVNDDERYGIAEEDWAFDDSKGHVEADEHEKTNSYKVGICCF